MTQVVGDASHIQGKPLSGNPSSGQGWVYDGEKYVPGETGGVGYKSVSIDGSATLAANHETDTLHISGCSGIKFTGISGAVADEDKILAEVSGLTASQIPNWSDISGMADYGSAAGQYASGTAAYASGKAEDASGLAASASGIAAGASGMAVDASGLAVVASGIAADASGMAAGASAKASYASGVLAAVAGASGFIMASGAGLAAAVPMPISGRVLKASGTNPLTDLYWGVDEIAAEGSGCGSSYAYISVQGITTVDANAPDDTLNMSGRSGIVLKAVSGSQGNDTIFFEISGLTSGQIPGWSGIAGAVTQLENTAALMAWDLYSEDHQFPDIAIDDFENQAGIDQSASTYTYHTPGHYCSDVAPSSGHTTDLAIQAAASLSLNDLKKEIAVWVQDSSFKGHFEGIARNLSGAAINMSGTVKIPCSGHGFVSGDLIEIRNTAHYNGTYTLASQSGGDDNNFIITGGFTAETFSGLASTSQRLTLGSGKDCPDIQAGVLAAFETGDTRTVTHISTSGAQNSGVELTGAQATGAVSAMYGLRVDEAAHNVLVNQTYDPNGANNSSTTDATPAQTSATAPYTVTESSINGVLSGWWAFDHILAGNSGWVSANAPSEANPHWVKIDFGSGTEKVFNKWRFAQRAGGATQSPPRDFKLQGSNDNSVWSDLDVHTGVDAPGTGNYTAWFPFVNASGYRYYRVYVTLANGASPSVTDIGEIQLVETPRVTPSAVYVAHTTDLSRLNTSDWSAITGIGCSQTTPGSSLLYHAISLNKGSANEKWKVYLSSVWRDIVRLNSGEWQFQNPSNVWIDADTGGDGTNSRLNALRQAFAYSQNRMGKTALEGLTSEFATVFAAGTLDFALGMAADGENLPVFSKYTVAYSKAHQDLVVVTEDWEASATDPEAAYVVFKVESNGVLDTDIKAWVSIDDGAHYEQVSGLKTILTVGNYRYVRGDLSGLTPRADKTVRLKITGHNSTSVNLHAVALGVKYS